MISRRSLVVLLLVAACGAPARPPVATPAPDATLIAARVEIARAEVRRERGLDVLAARARDADPAVRALAIRGLGRVGGHRAVALLVELITGEDAAAAAEALGLAGATGGVEAGDVRGVTDALAALAQRPSGPRREAIDALGRAGDVAMVAVMTRLLADPEVAAAAGIALGRATRRELALDDGARAAARAASASPDDDVRYGATYALVRASSTADAPDVAALAARLTDKVAAIRALAITGLARRKAGATATVIDALGDPDWRVQVEAVRALAGDGGSDEGRDAVAVNLVRTWAQVAAGKAPVAAIQPVLEGLRLLASSAGRPSVRGALVALAGAVDGRARAALPAPRRLAAAWVRGLALAALARAQSPVVTSSWRRADVTEPLADPASAMAALDELAAELGASEVGKLAIDATVGGVEAAPGAILTALAIWLRDDDAKVRAAALAAIGAQWGTITDDDDRSGVVAALVAGLGAATLDEVGAAAEAAGTTLAAPGKAPPALLAPLRDALIAKLAAPAGAGDVELTTSLLAAAATAKLDGVAARCELARRDGNAALAAAGRDCLKTLTGQDPGPAADAAEPIAPPVDPATVIGKRVTWTVATTAGTLVIALDPELAPWHVAALTALTTAHFYDGLRFHRVVPGFVVQGGDPTGAGWGGPGYTLPAEPTTTHYDAGVIGIADAGKDTGGSQWFAMHARAPHLEGRYTIVGRVVSGGDVVDALQIGDRILKATISID